MARMIDASRFGEILEQWKKDCLEDNDIQGADIILDVILQLDDMPTLTQPNEGSKDKNVPTNEPLTLDDLRKIDTVTPLWVHDLSWGRHKPRLMLVRYVAGHYWSCVDFDGFEIVKADDYGSRYLIYCRPPEGEEET